MKVAWPCDVGGIFAWRQGHARRLNLAPLSLFGIRFPGSGPVAHCDGLEVILLEANGVTASSAFGKIELRRGLGGARSALNLIGPAYDDVNIVRARIGLLYLLH